MSRYCRPKYRNSNFFRATWAIQTNVFLHVNTFSLQVIRHKSNERDAIEFTNASIEVDLKFASAFLNLPHRETESLFIP